MHFVNGGVNFDMSTPQKNFKSSPLKNDGKGRRSSFPFGQTAYFQGRTVKNFLGCTSRHGPVDLTIEIGLMLNEF